MKFKFGQLVKVNTDFYDGAVGIVVDVFDTGMPSESADNTVLNYKVNINNKGIETWIPEHDLELENKIG